MKCHYEVLDISCEATDSEIKTAYRKLALKWHPDKNLDNSDFAKEQFQEVQQAYEVLSDKHERVWYDSHREQILRGANSDFQDKSLDVFPYFTTTCFKGYGDDEHGFYSVYQKVFDQIAKEDIEFMDEKEEFCEIPGFGSSQSDYDTVVALFYNYWSSYSTKKSYSWLDPYDIREGKGDRRILKLIEKENKKNRQKARKERNDEIRNLVAFVRKRDKRVQLKMKEMEEKALENRKKHERLGKQKRLEQKKLHESEEQAEWTKFHNVKSELEEIEKHLAEQFGETLSNSEEEEEVEDFDNLYCIACNKMFKNPKAFQNHESSKKHKLNIEQLKESMIEDQESVISANLGDYINVNDENFLEDDIEDDSIINSNLESSDSEEELEGNDKLETKLTKNLGNNLKTDSDLEFDKEPLTASKCKKKNKKPKTAMVLEDHEKILEFALTADIEDSDKDFDFGETKRQKKKNKKNPSTNKPKTQQDDILSKNILKDLPENSSNKKRSKKEKLPKDKVLPSELAEVDVNHCCVTCKSKFQSKNKLFEHLKKLGHGVYLPSEVKQNVNENKKKTVRRE